MSVLWSIIPTDVVYQGFYGEQEPTEEITMGHATMAVTPAGQGMAKIERLISPYARDYLKPEWQPGALIRYPENTN